MPFNVNFDDITNYKVDAIVNGLSHYKKTVDELSKKILEKIENKKTLDSLTNKKRKIGDIIVTKSFNLPCNNIIHIVVPLKKMMISFIQILF